MTKQERILGALGAFAGLSGVALGALGAHALSNFMTPGYQDIFDIAVRYHLIHALAILVALAVPSPSRSLNLAAAWVFLGGIFIFSGSLYYYALTEVHLIRMATPLGGLIFMSGWLLMAFSFILPEPNEANS
jgi:uncharacterized membrane protein YgdD (TMEM256/DUF423 family)